MKYTTVLSIAGSDSCGGAGIQADIKTCCAHGVYAMTAITAVTAQNTCGVVGYEPVGAELMKLQLDAVCSDITPDAVKIGMVPDAQCAEVIADAIDIYGLRNIVLDPVMVATAGQSLSDESAMAVLRRRVFGKAAVLTPNLPEAATLLKTYGPQGSDTPTAQLLCECLDAPCVLLKGGHSDGEVMTDVLFDATTGKTFEFSHSRIATRNTHGTGCSLSSAIACGLAKGESLPEAVEHAIQWLQLAIEAGSRYELGHGFGPVNHLIKAKS